MTMTNNCLIWRHRQFFFDGVLFLLLSLVIDPGFLSVSSLVVELSQFSYVRDWPEIRNSEVPTSESSDLISGGLGKLGIPDLARMSLIKCYWMLENARITGFTISELINQQRGGGGGGKITPCNSTQINVKLFNCLCDWRIRQFLKLVSKFCEDFVADFLRKSDEGEFFSFLSKHAFKTKTPFSCLRKVNSCFAVNLNFLITGFAQHLKKYSHPEVFYRKVVIKHSTHGRLFK